jgi:hypothetical protein
LCPQFLKSTELQLPDRAFRPSERLGNFAHAFLIREAHLNHSPLISRECSYHPEQRGLAFHFLGARCIRCMFFFRDSSPLACFLPPAI